MNFGFADPPYVGLSKLYKDHPDYAGEVDHAALIGRLLTEYDGFALCLSARSLLSLAKLVPDDLLVLSWHKPIAPPMGDKYRYAWEPVIVRPLRRPSSCVTTTLTVSPPQYTFRPKPAGHVIGEKPEAFSRWVFEAAGLDPADNVDDLFPGSGAVHKAWLSWCSARLTTGPDRPPPGEQLQLLDAAKAEPGDRLSEPGPRPARDPRDPTT